MEEPTDPNHSTESSSCHSGTSSYEEIVPKPDNLLPLHQDSPISRRSQPWIPTAPRKQSQTLKNSTSQLSQQGCTGNASNSVSLESNGHLAGNGQQPQSDSPLAKSHEKAAQNQNLRNLSEDSNKNVLKRLVQDAENQSSRKMEMLKINSKEHLDSQAEQTVWQRLHSLLSKKGVVIAENRQEQIVCKIEELLNLPTNVGDAHRFILSLKAKVDKLTNELAISTQNNISSMLNSDILSMDRFQKTGTSALQQQVKMLQQKVEALSNQRLRIANFQDSDDDIEAQIISKMKRKLHVGYLEPNKDSVMSDKKIEEILEGIKSTKQQFTSILNAIEELKPLKINKRNSQELAQCLKSFGVEIASAIGKQLKPRQEEESTAAKMAVSFNRLTEWLAKPERLRPDSTDQPTGQGSNGNTQEFLIKIDELKHHSFRLNSEITQLKLEKESLIRQIGMTQSLPNCLGENGLVQMAQNSKDFCWNCLAKNNGFNNKVDFKNTQSTQESSNSDVQAHEAQRKTIEGQSFKINELQSHILNLHSKSNEEKVQIVAVCRNYDQALGNLTSILNQKEAQLELLKRHFDGLHHQEKNAGKIADFINACAYLSEGFSCERQVCCQLRNQIRQLHTRMMKGIREAQMSRAEQGNDEMAGKRLVGSYAAQ